MSAGQHTPGPERREYDEAVEALRQGLNALPRYSFLLDAKNNVCRVPDSCGRWIDWQSAHELFDTEMVDALLAKMHARAAIAKATGQQGGAA